MMEKEAISDKDLNFADPPSLTNGQGIYVRSGTESSSFPILYYRGNVTNNHVKFSDLCWKIVRTTETGGTKLIYNGIPSSDGSCNNTGTSSQTITREYLKIGVEGSYYFGTVGYMAGSSIALYPIKNGIFQSEIVTIIGSQTIRKNIIYANDISYDETTKGYNLVDPASGNVNLSQVATKYHYTCRGTNATRCAMAFYITDFSYTDSYDYIGLRNGTTIEDMKSDAVLNKNNSDVKSSIDSFYINNIQNNSSMLEDFVLCNDRSIQSGSLIGKDYDASVNTNTVFGPKQKLSGSTPQPTFACSNQNDTFTVDGSIGNGNLKYPIGLLTADEATFAGSGITGYSSTSYLYTGEPWWTMSPSSLSNGAANVFNVSLGLIEEDVKKVSGVRPVISLKSKIVPTSGTGTITDPYVIR